MATKSKEHASSSQYLLEKGFSTFKQAAKVYTESAISSRDKAASALVNTGTHTSSGNLSSKYK